MQKSATRNEIPAVESAIPFSTSLQKRAGQQGLLLSQGDTHTQTHIYYLNFEKQKTLKMQFHLLHHLTQTVKALKKPFKKNSFQINKSENTTCSSVVFIGCIQVDGCKYRFCVQVCNTSIFLFLLLYSYVQHIRVSKEYTSTRLDPILLIIRRWQLHMFALCATVVMQQSMPSVTRLDKQ